MWIKLHDALPDHPKVIAAAAALKIDKDLLVGKLARLWLWAATGRESGFIADYEAETVAEVMRWKKSPKALVDALCIAPTRYSSGLLDRVDGGYCIHDWDEQVSELIDTKERGREQTRNRVRRYRERQKEKDVARYAPLHGNATVTQCNADRQDKIRKEKIRDIKGGGVNAPAREDTLPGDEDNPFGDGPPPEPTVESYIANELPPLTPGNIEQLTALQDAGMQDDAIKMAVDVAAANNRRTWAYTHAILRRWLSDGITTAGAAKSAEADYQRKRAPPSRASPFTIPNDPERYKPRDDDFAAAAERMMQGE